MLKYPNLNLVYFLLIIKVAAMFKMDNGLLKKKIYDRCMELHLSKLKTIEDAIRDSQVGANEYGRQSDVFDSYQMQLIGKRDMYAQQLKVEMEMLKTLNKIDLSIKHNLVSFGSVVLTDLQSVFVSISQGKIMLENIPFYAISAKVPFYLAMKGLKKGDSFKFRGKEINILDVF